MEIMHGVCLACSPMNQEEGIRKKVRGDEKKKKVIARNKNKSKVKVTYFT